MRGQSVLAVLTVFQAVMVATLAVPDYNDFEQVRFGQQLADETMEPGSMTWRDTPTPFPPPPGQGNATGHGHFSKWARKTKVQFLHDISNNKGHDWVVTMGNEAGDLDSMVSALALAYTYAHLPEKPMKAVALLQTEQDALYLRPENSLALHHARMASHHRDLLTLDELAIKPTELSHRIRGIALVDHNRPLTMWANATVVSIFDHHADRGQHTEAKPRVIEMVGSCSTLVTKFMLDHIGPKEGKVDVMHGKIPHELINLLMRTIAIDTSGLKEGKHQPQDMTAAKRLQPLSSWSDDHLLKRMNKLDDELSKSKKDLDGLDVRALLRRDWKGDAVETRSKKYPMLSLGFASAPVSLEEQITRTPEGTTPEFFAIERAWTSEIGADVTVALTNAKGPDGVKRRQVALVVAHGFGKRLSERAADSLFAQLKSTIETAGVKMEPWMRPDGKQLLPRRAVYNLDPSETASRKFWRPLIEKAAREWQG